MARGVSSFSGKSGLLFHRNLIDTVSNFSSNLSKEFEKKYGIPVKFYFDARNIGSIKIKFRPKISASKLKESGITDLKATLKGFVASRLPSVSGFILKAIHETMGSSLVSTVTTTDSSGKSETTNWINDKNIISGDLKLK